MTKKVKETMEFKNHADDTWGEFWYSFEQSISRLPLEQCLASRKW